MKVAVVGLGYWGPNHVRNLAVSLGGDRVVVVDSSVDRLAAVCAQQPAVACATSLEQAIDEQEVDAAIIATPVGTHADLARTALEAGCHVMVEKPLASASDEARELVDMARARGRVLMVGHTFLFSPRVERIAEVLASGALGEIQYATSSRLNLGLHQQDVSVIWDLAPHDFSILFHLLGEFPSVVQTTGRCVVRPGTLDVAFINLQFPSGVVGSVTVSWLAPRKVRNTVIVGNSQMLVYDDIDSDEPVKVYDKGVVLPEPDNFGEHQLTYRYGDVHVPYVAPTEPLRQQLDHFVACVEGRALCRSGGEFGVAVVDALAAAEESWRRGGHPVDVAAHERARVG